MTTRIIMEKVLCSELTFAKGHSKPSSAIVKSTVLGEFKNNDIKIINASLDTILDHSYRLPKSKLQGLVFGHVTRRGIKPGKDYIIKQYPKKFGLLDKCECDNLVHNLEQCAENMRNNKCRMYPISVSLNYPRLLAKYKKKVATK